MIPTDSPSKPGKLKRALMLRPIEWAPVLVSVLINVMTGLWVVFSLSRKSGISSIPDPSAASDDLGAAFSAWNIVSYLCALLFLVGFGCWLMRVNSIIRED
jgi:hypothetical protein